MKRKLLALLLVFCLCFSLVVQSSAEEVSHDHESENQLIWSFDEAYGELYISGTGNVDPIHSADEQPWAQYREQIQYVYVDQEAMYFVEDIAYWFSGCTNLVYAEIPGYWFVIGEDAFKDCANLQELLILTHGTPEIADSAFAAESPVDLWIMVTSGESEAYVNAANWHGRAIDVANYANVATYDGPCGINNCSCTSCTYTYDYEYRDEDYHWKWAVCTNCTANEYAYGGRSSHVYNTSGVCKYCGYSGGSSSGGGSNCSHPSYAYGSWAYYSTRLHRRMKTCTSCGSKSYSSGYHTTTTQYEDYDDSVHLVSSYCSVCDTTISTLQADHNYTYGAWSSVSSAQHQRTASCATCGYSSYGYADHADNDGNGKCDDCSYSMTTTIIWDAFTNGGTIGGKQMMATNEGVGFTATAPDMIPVKTGHSFTNWFTDTSGGSIYSSVIITGEQIFYAQYSPNTYVITWETGTGLVMTTTQTYGQPLVMVGDPALENYTFAGWYTAKTGGTRVTGDTVFSETSDTTYYAQWAQTFSVTVPTSLPLVMDQDGNVNTSAAQIVNNSSEDVTISSVTLRGENGWKIVPYATKMAHQKVDAKVVGFSLNGAATAASGEEESLSLTGNWTIPQNGSLDLDYDAVISAVSQAVENETILSAIFVLKWS